MAYGRRTTNRGMRSRSVGRGRGTRAPMRSRRGRAPNNRRFGSVGRRPGGNNTITGWYWPNHITPPQPPTRSLTSGGNGGLYKTRRGQQGITSNDTQMDKWDQYNTRHR